MMEEETKIGNKDEEETEDFLPLHYRLVRPNTQTFLLSLVHFSLSLTFLSFVNFDYLMCTTKDAAVVTFELYQTLASLSDTFSRLNTTV